MFSFTICLLLTTAFAQRYAPAANQPQFSMDYNDDIYNRELSSFPSRLIFNFEQRRYDQPPQVDMRDESFSKYMEHSKTFATTQSTQRFKNMELSYDSEYAGSHQLHHPEVTFPPSTDKLYQTPHFRESHFSTEKPRSHLPAVIPEGPPMLKWMDLSDESFRNQNHNHPSRYSINQHQQSLPTQPPVGHWDNFMYKEQNYQNVRPANYQESRPLRNQKQSEQFLEPKPSRGNRKFNWGNDVGLESIIVNTTPAAREITTRKSLPPIPTLSPWKDGFGK